MEQKKVAMVSGAGRGMGLCIARELLAHGWYVSAGSRQNVPGFADFPADRFLWAHFDAQDPASEASWVKATVQRFGRMDGLVHNAGILSSMSVLEADDDEFDRLFEVNVKSPRRLTQQAWPHLAKTTGRIVVMASLAAKRVRSPQGSLYGMSKAAALSLAHGLRVCGEKDRVRCTAICPGFVDTDMTDGVDENLRAQLTKPEDVAALVRFVLELPPTASIAEIPVSWKVESQF